MTVPVHGTEKDHGSMVGAGCINRYVVGWMVLLGVDGMLGSDGGDGTPAVTANPFSQRTCHGF